MSAQLWARGGISICLCAVIACRADSEGGLATAVSMSARSVCACGEDATRGSLGGTTFCINLFGGGETYRAPEGGAVSFRYGPAEAGSRRSPPVVVIQAAVMDFERAVEVLVKNEFVVRTGNRPDGGAFAIAEQNGLHVIQHVIKARNGSLICRGITSARGADEEEIEAISTVCGSLHME